MPITDEEKWNEFVEGNNNHFYTKKCVDVARRVMEIIDEEEPEKIEADLLLNRADDETEGAMISVAMAEVIATAVWTNHSRGEEFRMAFNLENGIITKAGIANITTRMVGDKKVFISGIYRELPKDIDLKDLI